MTEPGSLPEFLLDGPQSAAITLALAHGAGASMDSEFMTAFAEGLATQGRGRWRLARFEFPYMAARRKEGRKRPPDPQDRLLETWRRVIAGLGPDRLVIGGKSLGARMASLVADECGVRALVCLGYPFHPPGKPESLRVAHLVDLKTPSLIVQGTRDPFGGATEVPDYPLSAAISLHWIEDGDHDLAPRKSGGRSATRSRAEAISAVGDFLERIAGHR